MRGAFESCFNYFRNRIGNFIETAVGVGPERKVNTLKSTLL